MNDVYDKYYDKLFLWAVSKTNNREDAEDLVNNVFLGIFTYLNKNIKIEKLDNLIWKVASNIWNRQALAYIRDKNNISYDNTYDLSSNIDYLDKVIYREIVDNLDNVGLTDKENRAFKLYYINCLSINEISSKLNTSVSSVKYYLYNARSKIKERYNA